MRALAVLAAAAIVTSCARAVIDPPAAPTTVERPRAQVAAAPSSQPPAPSPGAPASAADPIDPAIAQRAVEVARGYVAWGRIDDELRWAPGLCRMPMPAMPHMTQADAASPHGQKLYSVFVKDHATYPTKSEVGQVVVKESWVPELVDAAPPLEVNKLFALGIDADHFVPYAKKDGHTYRASRKAGLYIMMKIGEGAPGTDQAARLRSAVDHGWAYATVTAEGVVTAAGRVASCMGCHVSAPHDRLFGTPRSTILQ